MKKLLLAIGLCMHSVMAFAQGEIQFTLLKSEQTDIPPKVAEALDLKLKQVFNRNSAAAADGYNVFAIEPSLELTDVMQTEGMVQDVTVAKGELTLIAKNKVDGTMYYSMTIPTKGSIVGNHEKALLAMIAGIKITDTAFTRFIRLSRQKIQDYYAENCSVILQKAQELYDLQRYEEAMSYLSAISSTLPCHEQASVLMKELMPHLTTEPDTVVVEKIVEKVVEKPVVVEKVVEKPVVVEKVIEKPIVVEKVTNKPTTPKTPAQECEVTVSVTDLDVKVTRCYGNRTQRRITIELEVTNRNNNITNTNVDFLSAFASDGVEYGERHSLDRKSSWSPTKMPPQVKLKQNYYVVEVDHHIDSFSYIEMNIRNAKVVIRNLTVNW